MKNIILLLSICILLGCGEKNTNDNKFDSWGVTAPKIVRHQGGHVDFLDVRSGRSMDIFDEVQFSQKDLGKNFQLRIMTNCEGEQEVLHGEIKEIYSFYTLLPKPILANLNNDKEVFCDVYFEVMNNANDKHEFSLRNISFDLVKAKLKKYIVKNKKNVLVKSEGVFFEDIKVPEIAPVHVSCLSKTRVFDGLKELNRYYFTDEEMIINCYLFYKENNYLIISDNFKVNRMLIAPSIELLPYEEQVSFVYGSHIQLGELKILNNENYKMKLVIKKEELMAKLQVKFSISAVGKNYPIHSSTRTKLRLQESNGVELSENYYIIHLNSREEVYIGVKSQFEGENFGSLVCGFVKLPGSEALFSKYNITDYNFNLDNLKLYPVASDSDNFYLENHMGQMFSGYKELDYNSSFSNAGTYSCKSYWGEVTRGLGNSVGGSL